MLKRPPLAVALVLAILASASTWLYVDRILRAQQIADAAVHDRPRGNLSDLYPRWLGARELLLRGRNPYSNELTREIQQGYYGRPLDPSRPDDPKDQQGFAYPVYVVFLLASTVRLPFDIVQTAFRWLLFGLAAGSVLFWLRILGWRVACGTKIIFILLMLGWWPMVQAIKLQQLTLLVAGLLAACGACLTGGWLLCAGGLLALATIKPQLTWPLVLWLLLWAGTEWRSRWRFLFGFVLAMSMLLGGAEFILPGWLRMFVHAISQYHQYTQNQSVLVWLFGWIAGRTLEVVSVLACGLCVWQSRREPVTSAAFGRAFALVLALTVVIVPMFAPYNQVLLIPAILALILSEGSAEPILPAIRLARAVGALLFAWPWIATLALSAAYLWLTPEVRQKVWALPFYSNFVMPVFVFGLALLDVGMNSARNLRDGAPTE
ncbi:MAG TPA: glycosyltransferase 87 family protein [Candidatus Sulfotelmatobacter sp.]|nr:glycosyltransferase 87 family protein [Candidatus Sulfotelmatobacter sp.]